MADQFDEAAFDRAFDMAKEDMMLDAEENAQAEAEDQRAEEVEAIVEQEATSMLREIEETEKLHDYLANHSLHQPDIEHEPMEQMVEQREQVQQAEQQQAPYNDDDQLAATAQELLEKVEHNQSDKFKNSQFLGLMRRLRDREVRVEGDKMVETVSPTPNNPERVPAPTAFLSSISSVVDHPLLRDDVSDHEFDHWESPYT